MARTGPPSSYKEAYINELIECLALGHSITAFAGQIGVARSTVFEWMKKHPEFSMAYQIAKAKAVLHWEKTLLQFSKDNKGNAAAIIFALRNRAADDWIDKIVSEHSGPNGKPIEVANYTTADRARALAAFIAKTKLKDGE